MIGAERIGVGEPEHDDSRRRDHQSEAQIHLRLVVSAGVAVVSSVVAVVLGMFARLGVGGMLLFVLLTLVHLVVLQGRSRCVQAAWDDRTSRIRSYQTAALTDGAQDAIAGVLAPAARLRADAAVLMHLGVLLALLRAGLAGLSARLQHCAGDVGVVARVA